jgi:hypothetical protein
VRIAYDDEAGDEGFPKYSSPLFALSAVHVAPSGEFQHGAPLLQGQGILIGAAFPDIMK